MHFACCRSQLSEIEQLTLKLQNLTQQDEEMIARLVCHVMISVTY